MQNSSTFPQLTSKPLPPKKKTLTSKPLPPKKKTRVIPFLYRYGSR